MTSYGQFCPVAKSMEVLDERWTMLVVRELLAGSTHFNELRRGLPKMSPALLSKRLRTLERAGVVRRDIEDSRTSYTLTESGRDLAHVVDALSAWGIRWVRELGDADLDPHLLMWDIRRQGPVDAWPRARTVLAVNFEEISPKAAWWWLVVTDGQADVCDYDPGYDVAATVATSLRTLTRLWLGDVSWRQALRSGQVDVKGPVSARRAVPQWLGQSRLAEFSRPA